LSLNTQNPRTQNPEPRIPKISSLFFIFIANQIHFTMPIFSLKVNSSSREVNVDSGTSLLWVLREHLGLTGTKYSCGVGQCGSCTIHVDGNPMRACTLPVESVAKGQKITTIEGLSEKGDHPVQRAWEAHQVPQCGYCQSGQIMQAAALLEKNPKPSREEILQYMNGNLCRCGTYMRIYKAIESASKES
jgi:isoquinoline 1-oxidoreductase alpha subunit